MNCGQPRKPCTNLNRSWPPVVKSSSTHPISTPSAVCMANTFSKPVITPLLTSSPIGIITNASLSVLAHSTHLRGSGTMQNGREIPTVHVTLASQIPAADCVRLNLGYLDPNEVQIEAWQGREDEGILYVPKSGEVLYRLG